MGWKFICKWVKFKYLSFIICTAQIQMCVNKHNLIKWIDFWLSAEQLRSQFVYMFSASASKKPHYRPVYPIGTRGSSILLFRHSRHLLLTIGTAPTPTRTSQIVCCVASYMPHPPLLGIEVSSAFWADFGVLEIHPLTHHKTQLPKVCMCSQGDVDGVHWRSHQHHLCPFSRHLLKAE